MTFPAKHQGKERFVSEDPEYLFEKAASIYAACVIFLVMGFVFGWVLRGEQDEEFIAPLKKEHRRIEEENRQCAATLEMSWKQGREVAASAARCREALSKQFAKNIQ